MAARCRASPMTARLYLSSPSSTPRPLGGNINARAFAGNIVVSVPPRYWTDSTGLPRVNWPHKSSLPTNRPLCFCAQPHARRVERGAPVPRAPNPGPWPAILNGAEPQSHLTKRARITGLLTSRASQRMKTTQCSPRLAPKPRPVSPRLSLASSKLALQPSGGFAGRHCDLGHLQSLGDDGVASLALELSNCAESANEALPKDH
jgi:hypothetical protein